MVIEKIGDSRDALMSVLAAKQGFSGGFGIAWALVAQVAGWIIQGIGLGKSVYDATREAGEKLPPEQKLDQQDVDAVATALQSKFPATSKQSWTSLINEAMAGKVQPTAPAPECPTGFYRDPVTGACIEIERAGFKMPSWGWPVAIIGGIFLLPSVLSALRPAAGMSGVLEGAGCRDKKGRFVPVPQCTGKRPKPR